jgi:hypothetical protein
MFKSSLLVIGSFFLKIISFSQMPGPSIEEVAAKFYNTYDVSQQNIYINFERRNRQWKIGERKFEGSNLVAVGTYLFFDSDSGGYQKLPYRLKTDTQWIDFRQNLDSYTLSYFHLHRYFGYEGWYKDVIADLSGNDHLSDSSLYSLGRAYSSYASCLLADQTGDAIKSEIFNMPMARNCMTSEQREKYENIESQAIVCFSKLCKQNGEFETIVGKIPIKYANEVMVAFHTYLTYSDSFAEKYPLSDHLYPDSVVEKARQVLEKCPSGAILLSLGDNDFYPILYAQHKLGIRKDVYLINQNLIGLDRFIYRATQPQFQSKPIRLSVNYQQYKGNTNDYLFLGDSAGAMDFADVLDTIQSGSRDEYGILRLPKKEFIINRKIHNTINIDGDTVHFRDANSYLLKNEWILLDILNDLDGRSLCCQTLLDGSLSALNNYFLREDDNLFVY